MGVARSWAGPAGGLGHAGLGERVEEERDVEAVEGQAGQRAGLAVQRKS